VRTPAGLLTLALVLTGCSPPAPPAPAESSPPGRAVESETSAVAEPEVSVEVLSARRDAPATVEVRLALSHRSPGGAPIDVETRFASAEGDAGTIADIHLADPEGSGRYYVLREEDGRPLCSRNLEALSPGERREVWIRFPAPTGERTTVDVVVPGYESFRGVPLTE